MNALYYKEIQHSITNTIAWIRLDCQKLMSHKYINIRNNEKKTVYQIRNHFQTFSF